MSKIRCSGPCDVLLIDASKVPPDDLPEGWRFVLSRDPNAPRIEITFAPDSPIQADGPPLGPFVAMCAECASVTEAAGSN